MTDATLNLDLHDASGRLSQASLAWLRASVLAAGELMGVSGNLGVRIVGDAEMADAHQRYSGVAGTTDVLTFDLRDTDSATPPNLPPSRSLEIEDVSDKIYVRSKTVLCTDILACMDVAERESKVLGTSPERELLLYIIHGVLHCIGFDDHEESDAGLMHRVEDAVLTGIGVGPIYRP
jgi:probable rRNA maturation factor